MTALSDAGRPVMVEVVNSFHLGGTEGQVVELLRGLRARWRTRIAGLHLEGPHLDGVRALGEEPYGVRIGKSLARPGTLAEIARMARWLRSEGAELVHVHDFYSTLIGVPAAKLAGCKVVVSRLDLSHFLSPAQRALLAAMTRWADHVVANAGAVKRAICQSEKLPPGRVSVIPNGIDLSRFDQQSAAEPSGPLPDREGKVVVVHVANMVHPVKAQEDLLHAMQRVIAHTPQAVLWLVGDGPREPQLKRLSAELGLQAHVFFLGRRTGVPAILSRADIGVLPSLAEGLSNALIEYMAASLPAVASDAGGNGELVRDGQNGYLVRPASPVELADRIWRLVGDAVQRRRLGQAGRAFVERELGLQKLISRHDSVYRSLLVSDTAVATGRVPLRGSV